MDLGDIRMFLRLASVGHFGRASEELHVSPSTLSRCIRRLEEELGVLLFERDNRSVRVTPEGRSVENFWIEVLDRWQQELWDLNGDTNNLVGEISLFCSVTASYSVLATVLKGFKVAYPSIDIKLHTGDPAEAISRVTAGSQSMAIAARPFELPESVAFQEVARSPLLFIVPKEASVVSGLMQAGVNDEFWRKVPFIVSERGVARERLEAWFSSLGVVPNIYAQVAGNEAIVSMVALGFGVGVVPELVLENSPQRDRVSVLPVASELEPFSVGLVCLKKRLANSLLKAFWGHVVKQSENLLKP